MTTEQWRDIPGYEGQYQASDLGRVRSVDHRVRVVVHGVETTRLSPGRLLRPGLTQSGHLSVALGRGNSKGVHTLVLKTFVGPPPEGHEALHLNHTPSDNRLVNLKWGTRGENVTMDYEVGKRKSKAEHTQSKIDLALARQIKAMRGASQRDIAAMVGVAQSQVCLVLSGKHWTSRHAVD